MRLSVLSFVLLFSPLAVFAQTVDRNAVYIEIGGNAIAPSINYERRVSDLWAFRVGLTHVTVTTTGDGNEETDSATAIPLMMNRISAPASNHHFETGFGLLLIAGENEGFDGDFEEDFTGLAGTVTAGYRYQKPQGGFVFRAGVTPIFDLEDIVPWAGISFGYAW